MGFGAPGGNPIATYDENKSLWHWDETHPANDTPRQLHKQINSLPALKEFQLEKLVLEEKVFLLKASLGDKGTLARAAVSLQERGGIVVEGFGIGDVSPDLGAALEEACARGVLVVMTTRCASGGAYAVYGAEGGGHGLAQAGVLFASSLSGLKVRILLMVLLGLGADKEQIAGLL